VSNKKGYLSGWILIFLSAFSIADEEAVKLLKKVDELYRATQATAMMEMRIETPNWQRTMKLQSWSRGMEDTFIRVLAPKKDRGVATLKLDQEMWNFFPKINKTIKVPPSMMMGSWMVPISPMMISCVKCPWWKIILFIVPIKPIPFF